MACASPELIIYYVSIHYDIMCVICIVLYVSRYNTISTYYVMIRIYVSIYYNMIYVIIV